MWGGPPPPRTPNRIRTSARSSSAQRPRLLPRRSPAWSLATRMSGRRTHEAPQFREFDKRRDGMIYAMDGGLWLHRHRWKGKALAHLVSTDKELLLRYGAAVGI